MLVVATGRALLAVLLWLRTRLLHLLRMKLLTRRLLSLRLRTWFRTRLLLDLRPLDRFGVLRMLLLPHRRILHGARHLA
jgi:hypothetical protein